MVGRQGLRERLQDIRSAGEDAISFTASLAATEFIALPVSDQRTYRALKNALTEIGEAVKALPGEVLARHPLVDWRGWAALRDVISHQYFQLELHRLRPAVTQELPSLLDAIRAELAQLTDDGPPV